MDARPYMLLDLAAAPPVRNQGGTRLILDEDLPALAGIMADAYLGTVDGEGEDHHAALRELQATAGGTYGPALRYAWVLHEREGEAKAAVLCTRWRDVPFIAFVFTAPDVQRQGVATELILAAAQELRAAGESRLSLIVTRRNPALSLYQHLGFVETDRPEGQ